MTTASHVVVGGGPAAAAAAAAISATGRAVLVIEPGVRLEREREAKRQRLAATTPDHWEATDLEVFSYEKAAGAGLGQKRLFGSDFPYANPGLAAVEFRGVGAHPSFAAGGLSNVWGAGLLPYSERDLDDWPLKSTDLAPHYAAASELLPLAAQHDELSERYPLFKEPDGALIRSDEGERMLARLGGRGRLRARGWRVGGARLAVRAGRPAPAAGCIYCGRCLDGCPYGHIYSSAQTIDALHGSGAISYRPGELVERVIDDSRSVTLELRSVASGERSSVVAERVYLGAGALSTTFILQRSGILPDKVELLDSQTLYLPMLWLGAPAPRSDDGRYALAQVFALLESPTVSERAVHLSLYGYSSEIPDRVRDLRPGIARLFGPLLERATRQLVFAIAFLHSNDSATFTSQMNRDGFVLEAGDRSRAALAIGRLKRRLGRDFAASGILPLIPAAETAPPGGGYHFGGSVPMHASPIEGQSDLLGRPHGTGRVHVIDSACFPTIPAGPITLSIMANSHRIATELATGT